MFFCTVRTPSFILNCQNDDFCNQAKCKKAKNFILHYGLLGAFERSSSKCLLEAIEPRIQLPASRPPVESADDVRHSCLLDRIQKNTMLYSDGALAWPKVSKEMRKGFRIKQVSHRNQEFLRGRNIGTQIADSRWKSLQSWLPKSVKTLYKGRLNTQLMVYVRSWQYRFQNQHKYLQTLGKLFKTKNSD